MQSIRVIAVGLLLAAALAIHFSPDFFQWWVSGAEFQAWGLAIVTVAPAAAHQAGTHVIGAGVFLLLCLGAGLFASSIVWPLAEQLVLGLFAMKSPCPSAALLTPSLMHSKE